MDLKIPKSYSPKVDRSIPVKPGEIRKETQKDIDRLNADPRRYLDLWFDGGDLKRVDYVSLVLQLKMIEALEKGKRK